MTLLQRVSIRLETAGIPFALIGAAALALRGVSRSTADVDLLTVDTRCLDEALWEDLRAEGHGLRLLKGDFEDPLAGSVRISPTTGRMVDVVVGRYKWQMEIIQRAERLSTGDLVLPVARSADLILLKLFAGGPKDAWDISALLEARPDDQAALTVAVEGELGRLPSECRDLWSRIMSGR